ncbi:D-arabinono-1,4-lactone oxidase [Ceratocystis pirilliformis]|uniref:D-arabinono-1,4-lactone oxidase n=1 Tax=Ceratocystis pirilliformis TaxID=259994 RepID=A0ABR3ZKL1_9PEZI
MNSSIGDEIHKASGDGVPFRARPNHVHRTWARTFSSLPELYIQPESLAEIEKVVNLARRCRRRLVTVGSGHSPSNITCTSSWLVNLDNYNKIISLNAETGQVVMQSGIRLYMLNDILERHGLAMPNLGSINEQSIAGVISTGTHGSSLQHGLVSESISSLKITLADGSTQYCSAEENTELFRGALLSLGALGIITEITFQAVPAFKLRWDQVIDADSRVLITWDTDLWTRGEYVRVWWLPHTRRAVIWQANRTDDPETPPPTGYYGGILGYYIYHNLLYLGLWIPKVLPWVEWFVFGMQHGFHNGTHKSAVQQSRQALLMDCLYSQWVNEWALPLQKGKEFLRRFSTWLNKLPPSDPDYMEPNIPYSSDGLYIHSPVEVRVSDSRAKGAIRPYLDTSMVDSPTLYVNATLYRPYDMDPDYLFRYYAAFEHIMTELGGRPHWAKNFHTTAKDFEAFYGPDLEAWRQVRNSIDPDGMFAGPWHRKMVLERNRPKLELEEELVEEQTQHRAGTLFMGRQVEEEL